MSRNEQQAEKPIDRVVSLLQNAKETSRGITACCPAHNDKNPSLSVWEDETDGHVRLLCWAGCRLETIVTSIGLTMADLYVENASSDRPQHKQCTIDLLDLARDKVIHPTFLINQGLTDDYRYKGNKVIRIPYYTMDGTEYTRFRIRTAVTARDGSAWSRGSDPIIPYGLHKLSEAQEAGYLILPEGESDCLTCWYHDVPALGIPGASSSNTLQAEHVTAFPPALYLIQEPAGPNQNDAGKNYIEGMTKRLATLAYKGNVYAASLKKSHDVKDPNALHQLLHKEGRPKDFKNELQRAMDAAQLINIYESDKKDTAGAFEETQTLVMDAIEKKDCGGIYNLAEKIAALDTKEQAQLTGSIREGMNRCKAFSWSDLKKLLTEEGKRKKEQTRKAYVTGKPRVLLGRQLYAEIDDTLDALYKANHPPTLFVRGGMMARWRADERLKPTIETVDENILIERMTRVAEFETFNEQKDDYSSAYPTSRIARSILATATWKFPPLRGITEVPIVRDDGTILDIPGYDPQSHFYYVPQSGLEIPNIPLYPTQNDARLAAEYVWEHIGDFPYEKQTDAANAFGPPVTTVIRSMVDLVPMADITAKQAGTGKGEYCDFVAILQTGRECPITTLPPNEEEMGKTLTTFAIDGSSIICLDNINRPLISAKLEAFLTARIHKGRVLGESKAPETEQNCMVLANGNNLQIGGDLPRRGYWIRMDAGISRPWTRKGFRYTPLTTYATVNRGKLIAALLTMVRAWFVAGCPEAKIEHATLGTKFHKWTRVVSGVLAYAGIEGFLGNQNEMYNVADVDGPAWEAFLLAWQAIFEDKEVMVSELEKSLRANANFADMLPDPLASQFSDQSTSSTSFKKKLGKALSKRDGMPFGEKNLKLLKGEEDTHAKVATWRVAGFAGPQNANPQANPAKNSPFKPMQKEGVNQPVEPAQQDMSNNDLRGLRGLRVSSSAYTEEKNNFFPHTNEEYTNEEKIIISYREGGEKHPPNPPNPATDIAVPPYNPLLQEDTGGLVEPIYGYQYATQTTHSQASSFAGFHAGFQNANPAKTEQDQVGTTSQRRKVRI